MAEEFQTGICGGTWWSSSRSSFSPCSAVGIGLATDHMGSFLWSSSDLVDEKTTTRSCEESNNSVSADSSIVFHGAQKPQQTDSDSGGSSGLMDSTLQMMSFGLSSSSASSTDWNQALLRGSGTESYHSIIQEDMSSRLSYRQETGMDISQIQKDWSPKSFASAGEDCSINGFRSISQDFPLDQLQLKSVTSSDTCQGSSAGFSTGSASYMYPLTSLQTLYETQPQQPPFNNRSMSYSSTANYGTNSNQLSPTSWPKFAPGMLKPSLPKQLPSSMHFSNNTPFWNASANALNENKAGFFTSSQSQFLAPALEEKPNCPSNTTKSNKEDVQDPGSMLKKGSSEPAFKRPRIETPSPLPTFKVRKEKLGDRITALQQLVSPFGKTDTASVLHEAIEYIKFLHDQVSVLSTPYMKQGTPIQQSSEKLKDPEAAKQDLRSRGLCLVPISSTFPVTNETPADFWTPTFGGAFR